MDFLKKYIYILLFNNSYKKQKNIFFIYSSNLKLIFERKILFHIFLEKNLKNEITENNLILEKNIYN